MNKLLILYSTIRELTTNSTNYYQLTNYYVDKTKLLFLHGTTTFWCITFHQSVLHLFSKLLLSCYQTTISETEKDYWIIYKQESTFESWQSVFFPAFLFFDEILFLKLTRTAWHGFPFRNCSTAVFAFWRGYIKGVEWLCTLFVRCNTGVILIQSTSTRQPLCARCVLPVGWSCWPHCTRWMYHRTVPMVDTTLQSAGVCLWGSWFFWTRLWWHPRHLLGFQLWGTLSVSH